MSSNMQNKYARVKHPLKQSDQEAEPKEKINFGRQSKRRFEPSFFFVGGEWQENKKEKENKQ